MKSPIRNSIFFLVASLSGTCGALAQTNYALHFDGTQLAKILNTTPTGWVSTHTIECWVKADADPSSGEGDVISFDTYTSPGSCRQGFRLIRTTSGNYEYQLDPAGCDNPHQLDYIIPTDSWVHLAASYNGTTMKYYINGKLVSSKPASGATGAAGIVGANFSGDIDEIQIWDIARSDSDIATTRCTRYTGSPSYPSHLVAYWPLDDNTGQTATNVIDSSRNIQLGSTSGSDSDDPTWVESEAPFDYACIPDPAECYANCDGSTGSPLLTAADFTCFLAKFRLGCP